jgi:hypothetical protein
MFPETGILENGNYDIKAKQAHQYARGNGEDFLFPCHGGSKGGRYPEQFYTPSVWRPKALGKTLEVDMTRSRYIAGNANTGWDTKTNYNARSGGWMNSGDNSGLIYGIDGVCHQIANSLYCGTGKGAGNAVSRPKNFGLSYSWYGWRGKFAGPPLGLPPRLTYLMVKYGEGAPSGLDETGNDPLAAYLNWPFNPGAREEELVMLYEEGLAELPDRAVFVANDRRFAETKHELDVALLRGEVDPDAFCEAVNSSFSRMVESQFASLGVQVASGFYGSGDGAELVSPELMLSADSYGVVGQTYLA